MVRHIVLWQYTDEIRNGDPDRTTALIREKFETLLGVIPGLLTIEIGQNYKKDSEYDIALYCEFATREDEKNYQTSPEHVAIKNLTKDWVCGRASMDYEI